MLRLMHSSTTRRTTLMLARWPAGRGMPVDRAQRPLPSMIIATCCGVSAISSIEAHAGRLDLHQLLLFFRHRMIDLGDVLVGEFLDLLLRAPVLVLGDQLLLQNFFQLGHDCAAH